MRFKIYFYVFTVHLLFLVGASVASRPAAKRSAIKIHTVTWQPPIAAPKAAKKLAKAEPLKAPPAEEIAAPAPQQQPKPIGKPPEKKKETPVKSAVKKVATTSKKQATVPVKKEVKKAEKSRAEKLLQDIERSLAKLEEKTAPLPTKKADSLPKTPVLSTAKYTPTKSVEKEMTQPALSEKESAAFTSTLVHALQDSLNLPEYGIVKIQLALDAAGHVISMKVLESESEKNRAYLEQMLPGLAFPSIELLRMKEDERQFILRFCNEL